MKAISFSTIIVAIVINFFLILTPVAGVGGWYIDEDTCDGEAVEFFQSQLQRAAFAHANLATAFGSMRNQLPEELQMLVLAVLGSGNYENTADAIAAAIAAANVVFLGGSDPTNSQDNYPYIRGLSSWNTAVSQLATSRYPNGLKIYCKATRLGRATWNGESVTFDTESQTTYRTEMPPCGAQWEHGSAIVLTHYAERNSGQTGYEPDRVTFCEWFSNEVVADAIIGAVLTTERSIYTSRAKMIDFEDGNADVDMAAWRAWRNVELGGGSNLPDIVWSLGFDTFLTLVLAHCSAGGFKGTIGGVTRVGVVTDHPYSSDIMVPVDSWAINQDLPKVALPYSNPGVAASKALPYMLLNSIINNYAAGLGIDSVSGNYLDTVGEYYPNCDFMANYIPFETDGNGCADDGLEDRK